MRSAARECVLKYLYAQSMNDGDNSGLFDRLLRDEKLSAEDQAFARALLHTVEENRETLLSEISELSIGFKLERLFEIDKCALLIGMAEIGYSEEIPFVVSVNEAVNLVAKYSTEKSTGFVNGILAEYGKKRGVRQ